MHNLLARHPKIATVVVALLIAFVGVRIYRMVVHPSEPEVILAYYERVADQARQAAVYLDKKAKVVVLVSDFELRSVNDGPLRAMIKALKEEGLNVKHVERLVMDTSGYWSDSIPGFPYEEFLRVARDTPHIDAVISLCGVPYLAPETDRPDPSGLPPLLVPRAVADSENLTDLLDEGRVVMAAVIRNQRPDWQKDREVSGGEDAFRLLSADGWEPR